MVLSTETFNQSVRTEYSEAVNARYTFQPLWVSANIGCTGPALRTSISERQLMEMFQKCCMGGDKDETVLQIVAECSVAECSAWSRVLPSLSRFHHLNIVGCLLKKKLTKGEGWSECPCSALARRCHKIW